jgi:hypothetical protein
MVTF